MKKLVSVFIVLVMVLSMLPMAVLAAPGTYELTVGSGQYIDLDGFDSLTLSVTTGDDAVILKVDGEGNWYDWYIDNGMQQFFPSPSGAYELELGANQTHNLILVSDGTLDTQTLYVSVKAHVLGSEDNPAAMVMGENSAIVDGISPYFFGWTAEEDGELTISIDTSKCSDWSFQINRKPTSGAVKVGETNYSDVTPVISTETVFVNAGDFCTVNVNSAAWGVAGTIYFTASFTAKTSGGGEGGEGGEGGSDSEIIGTVIESASVTLQSETGITDAQKHKVVNYTATAEGMVYITMSSTDKGWSMLAYKNGEALTWMRTGKEKETFSYPVKPGDVMMFELGAYDPKETWSVVDGKIDYVVSFQAGTVEIEKDLYAISDTALYLGANDLTMIETAENTLFEFVPTETGVYTFTAPVGTLLGNWGMFFNPMDNTGDNKTNTIQWTCTDVGQSVLIGVVGSEDVVIEAERTGDYVPAPVVEWTVYKNTAKLDYFELDPDFELISVDVTDDVADAAVLGDDGFYHYGTADGPILFADLNQYLIPASSNGKVSYIVYDEDGNIVDRIDYTEAVIEYSIYADGGIYPLSEDLMKFYKHFGAAQGWYDPNGLGFYLFGEDEVDPETAWLFACYYDENVTSFKSEYYVAGDAGLCGSEWTPGDEANQMIMNADGTCSITYNNVAAGKYMFKVTQTDWDMDSWGGDGPDGNYVIELGMETFVTINFDPATGEITVATGENIQTGDYSIAGLIVAMMTATAGAVVLSKKKEF